MNTLALFIAVFGEELAELGFGEDAYLRQTIHSSSHVGHEKYVVHEYN